MKTYPRVVALALGLVISLSTCPNICQASSYEKKSGTIAADVFVWRPAGLLLTISGSVLFVLILPATAIAGGTKETADTLVKTPFNFTFRRPMGTDLRDYLDESY